MRLQVPNAVDFGSYSLGSPVLVRPVVVTNTGNAVLSLSSVTVTAPFVLTNACPENLAPGEACSLLVEFRPDRTGDFSGTLLIVSWLTLAVAAAWPRG